jgi:hypothetical protein
VQLFHAAPRASTALNPVEPRDPGAAARLIRNLFVAASLPEPAEVINESVLSDFKRLRHN